MICYIKFNIFIVVDIIVFDGGICFLIINIYCRVNCKKNNLFKNLLGNNKVIYFIIKYKGNINLYMYFG